LLPGPHKIIIAFDFSIKAVLQAAFFLLSLLSVIECFRRAVALPTGRQAKEMTTVREFLEVKAF
jgi:hypothetical protein